MRTRRRAHRGAALLLGLLLLAAISLLAVMAANGMLLQRRMASNHQDRQQALQNADLAAAAARAWLFSRSDVEREAGCETGCLLPPAIRQPDDLPERPEFEGAAWWRLNGTLAGVHPESGDPLGMFLASVGDARWLIAEVNHEPFTTAASGAAPDGIGYYRIFGRGTGLQAGSVAVTESIVARPWEGSYEPADYPPPADSPGFCRQFDAAVPCGALAWRQRK